MEPIGEQLSEARKRLGINLREASEATKIRSDYLQQMENGTFDFSLPAVYKRGFLKIYARYLDLDPEQLAADFNAEFYGALARSSKRETTDNLGRVDASGPGAASPDMPMSYDPTAEENRAMMVRVGTMIAVVVVVVLLIYAGLQHLLNASSSDASAKNTVANSSASANLTANATVRTPPPSAPRTPPPAAMQFTFTARGDIASLAVRQLYDRRELYNNSLRNGQSASVTSQGPVEVIASKTENLVITQNGKAFFAADLAGKQLTGAQKFTWPPGSTP